MIRNSTYRYSALLISTTLLGCSGSSPDTGGTTGQGGGAASGGTTGNAGTVSSGGTTSTSGTGGVTVAGGSPAKGGNNSSGGAAATGGASSTGGVVAIGGTATGGSLATGGAATAGNPATGGKSSTGGATTGGTTAAGGTTSSVGVCALSAAGNGGFVHPGGLHTKADLDRMKAQVAAGAHPWVDDWKVLIADSQAQNTYAAAPNADMGANRQRADADAHAAYLNTIRWYISGDTSYADAAVRICNAWSSAVNAVPSNGGLVGLPIMSFALVGELLRIYSGWNATDFHGSRT